MREQPCLHPGLRNCLRNLMPPLFALVDALWLALGAYFVIGVCFAITFAAFGAQAVDPAAKDMRLAVRVLILPGAAALWPLLASKWLRKQPPPLQ